MKTNKQYNDSMWLFLIALACLMATVIFTGCVSLKKHNALENAYQKAGFLIRELEQDNKILKIDIQECKKK